VRPRLIWRGCANLGPAAAVGLRIPIAFPAYVSHVARSRASRASSCFAPARNSCPAAAAAAGIATATADAVADADADVALLHPPSGSPSYRLSSVTLSLSLLLSLPRFFVCSRFTYLLFSPFRLDRSSLPLDRFLHPSHRAIRDHTRVRKRARSDAERGDIYRDDKNMSMIGSQNLPIRRCQPAVR